MKDINQIVIFKGNDILYCNIAILEAIKNSRFIKHVEIDNEIKGSIALYNGYRLLKVSKNKMRELLRKIELINK
ncbi:MAG: hypothetical protein WC438_06350 [Candidatus Pacearchaeota archaeon]